MLRQRAAEVVVGRTHLPGRHVAPKEEPLRVLVVAHADMPEGIDDALVEQDAIRGHEVGEEGRIGGRCRIGSVLGSRDRRALFGGMKNSGVGREEGIEELFSYTETKNINIML